KSTWRRKLGTPSLFSARSRAAGKHGRRRARHPLEVYPSRGRVDMRKSRILSRVLVSAVIATLFVTAAEAAPQGPCTPPGAWSQRADYTTTISRAWGAFFPADGKFYLMGGRPDDGGGTDFIQVHIYDPATDTWSESNATFPD